MNDLIYVAIGTAVIFAGFVAFAGFHLYSGVHGSLKNARVGEVFNFEYEQPLHGDRKRVLAQVIEPVSTLDDYAIKSLNARSRYRRYDPDFRRTNHLVTCKMPNGDIRQFYAERATNVRRSFFSHGLFKVAAMLV